MALRKFYLGQRWVIAASRAAAIRAFIHDYYFNNRDYERMVREEIREA